MNDLLKTELPIQCPGGGKTEKLRLDKILSSSSIKTSKGEYKIKPPAKNKMNAHLKKMEMEKGKYEKMMKIMMGQFNELYAELFKTADITIKR